MQHLGGIWFPAENHGVFHYNEGRFKNYNESDDLASNAIQTIYEDRNGIFWFGGYKGLFQLKDTKIYSITKMNLLEN